MIKTLLLTENSFRESVAYIGTMAGVEGAEHAIADPTVKIICQTLVTLFYIAYATIVIIKKYKKELKDDDK